MLFQTLAGFKNYEIICQQHMAESKYHMNSRDNRHECLQCIYSSFNLNSQKCHRSYRTRGDVNS